MNITDSKIAIIGLGYVGLPLAVEFGKKFETLGFDINQKRISELNAGRDSTLEVSESELASTTMLVFLITFLILKIVMFISSLFQPLSTITNSLI